MKRTVRAILATLGLMHALTAFAADATPEISAHIAARAARAHGEEYSAVRHVRSVSLSDGGHVALVFYTLEGFDGGNDWRQYLGVFATRRGRLVPLGDKAVGGRDWRALEGEKAVARHDAKRHEIVLTCPAMINRDTDPPNFPSKKGTVAYRIKIDGKARFRETRQE